MQFASLRKVFFLSFVTFISAWNLPAAAVSMSAPAAGARLSGQVAFRALAPGAVTVDFWIAGHSIVSGPPPSESPFETLVDTTLQLDGPQQVVAVARDASQNIIGISPPVSYTIDNTSLTSLSLASPDLAEPLSGPVSFTLTAQDARGIQMYVYAVDGNAQGNYHFNSASSDTFLLDTSTLANGLHYLAASVVPNAGPGLDPNSTYATAQAVVQFTVVNDPAPLALRANFRSLSFSADRTAPVRLSAFLADNAGALTPQQAEYTSNRPEVATVTSEGVVAPGPVQGIASITVSAAGLATIVTVKNVTSHGGFSHFTHDGHIVNAYDPDKSLWVRSLFNTSMVSLMNTPGFADAFTAAASNVLNPGVYQNPAFYGTTNFSQFIASAGVALVTQLGALADNNFYIVGTGDDFNRGDVPLNNTLANPFTPSSQSVIDYTLTQLVASGRVISLEMQDEIGCQAGPDCVGARYRQEMALMNSFPARPPMSWPAASADVVKAWQGDPSISDYASLYWTFNAGQLRPAFGINWSLNDLKRSLEKTRTEVYPVTQISRPAYLETFSNGIGYIKRTPGDHYHIGRDQVVLPGVKAASVAAQILYAAALGYAGVRSYGYDGWSVNSDYPNDSGWLYHRSTDAVAAGSGVFQQTGAGPFGSQADVLDRWTGISNAFHAIQDLEPYFLSPQIASVDLGDDIVTGARQLSDGTGRLFLAINMSDRLQTIQPDLSSYLYPGGGTLARYRLTGLLSSHDTVPGDPSPLLTLAPGEVVIWVFTDSGSPAASGAGPGPRVVVTAPEPNQSVSGSITLSLSAFDPTGIASAQFQVDGLNVGSTAALSPSLSPKLDWKYTLDTTDLSDGTHLISATASNAAGQQATAPAIVIVVKNRASEPAVCSIPGTPGLLAAWPLADGSGALASEASGQGTPLALDNPSWAAPAFCKLSACLSFDGASRSGRANLDLSAAPAVSVSFWMNPARYTDTDGIAVEFGADIYGFNGPAGGFLINPNSSAQGGGFFEASLKGNAGYTQILFSRPAPGSWRQYTFVFDPSAGGNTQVTPYVDGVAVSYSSSATVRNTGTFPAGLLSVMSRNGQSLFGSGLLQDLRVYGRALSASEVASLFQQGSDSLHCGAAVPAPPAN